jgi:hypothetical protein
MKMSRDLLDAYLSMVPDLKPDLFISLCTFPGSNVPAPSMFSLLKNFEARVDYLALGRNWAKKPAEQRINGIYVLEFGVSRLNPHWHGFVRTPDGDVAAYENWINEAWKKTGFKSWVESSPEKIKEWTESPDYIYKGVHDDLTDRVVLSSMHR